MEDQQQQTQPIPVQQVLQTIRAAMSHHNAERAPAESALRGWEADAAPGFLHSLMLIVHEAGAIDEVGLAMCSHALSTGLMYIQIKLGVLNMQWKAFQLPATPACNLRGG